MLEVVNVWTGTKAGGNDPVGTYTRTTGLDPLAILTVSHTPDIVLQGAPRWRASDLGEPLPASPCANSVCLPVWQDVVGYEEKDPRVRADYTLD